MADQKEDYKFYGFPHIEKLADIHKELKRNYRERVLPIYNFIGSVKVHGINASIMLLPDNSLQYQSRNNVLLAVDNLGFKKFMLKRENILMQLFNELKITNNIENAVIGIYGEYAGKGIQKRVAISVVEPFFIIFAIRIYYENNENNYWLNFNEFKHIKCIEQRIINITDFPMYEIEIDFNNIESAQFLLDKYTKEVYDNCPIGKYFGVDGLGEGIVWHATGHDNQKRYKKNESFGFMFKTKPKEAEMMQSKKIKQINEMDDKENIINEFAKSMVIKRLDQGISIITETCELTKENSMKKLGEFIKFIVSDILREERILIDQTFELVDVNTLKKTITNIAKEWYIQYIDTTLGAAQTSDTPLGAAQTNDIPLGAAQTSDTPLGAAQTSDTPLGAAQTSDTPLGAAQTNDIPLGAAQTSDTPLGAAQTSDTL
jgi:hypothetical protein